jgi:NAD(P)-dependent dehydrogenase (short-subunit alcohol dehydrogenase family)
MRTALVLGGTGQIGIPAARRLAKDGWEVTVAARGEAADIRLDRTVPGELEAAADGFDLLVDVVPYTSADAMQLASRFIGMYVNEFTRNYGAIGRAAIRRFLAEAHEKKYISVPIEIQFVE